jgi:integrase
VILRASGVIRPAHGVAELIILETYLRGFGYRHGLCVAELNDLQWSHVELTAARLHVPRVKNGSPSVHSLRGDEIRALRRFLRERGASAHVLSSERRRPLSGPTEQDHGSGGDTAVGGEKRKPRKGRLSSPAGT